MSDLLRGSICSVIFLTDKQMQACNAQGLYCVPLYDTLGMYFFTIISCYFYQEQAKKKPTHYVIIY